jgi:hypothetical protein
MRKSTVFLIELMKEIRIAQKNFESQAEANFRLLEKHQTENRQNNLIGVLKISFSKVRSKTIAPI